MRLPIVAVTHILSTPFVNAYFFFTRLPPKSPEVSSLTSSSSSIAHSIGLVDITMTSNEEFPQQRRSLLRLPCRDLQRTGECPRGALCIYSHNVEAVNHSAIGQHSQLNTSMSASAGRGQSRSEVLCRFWLRGHCQQGEACRFRHSHREDTPCLHWMNKGYCSRDNVGKCHFSHPPHLAAPLITLYLVGGPLAEFGRATLSQKPSIDVSSSAENLMSNFEEVSSFGWSMLKPVGITVPGT